MLVGSQFTGISRLPITGAPIWIPWRESWSMPSRESDADHVFVRFRKNKSKMD